MQILRLLVGLLLLSHLAACAGALNWQSSSSSAVDAKRSQRWQSNRALPATHVVRRGETLYSIAWHYQLDYRALARWNARSDNPLIYPGEALVLRPKNRVASKSKKIKSQPDEVQSARSVYTAVQSSEPTLAVRWQWPLKGVVLDSQRASSGRLKGLLLKAESGQPVLAAASGEVVYIGSGLRGYGVLIIIKHSDKYLSAYAHSSQVYVKEGVRVIGGQPIAQVGEVANIGPALRFDIREAGKSIDPLALLPR